MIVSRRLRHINNWDELGECVNWSATALAKNCNVSLRTLQRYFLKTMGRSPKEWLQVQRQIKASELLNRGWTVKEVAGRVGYKYVSSFSHGFVKHWNISPGAHNTTRTTNEKSVA
jgi:transcriptional regulator GlxA family with amidase domain